MCTSLFDHVFSDVPQMENTHDFSETANKTVTSITHILYHLRDNHRNILEILNCDSGEIFLEFFRQYLKDLISKYVVITIPPEVPEDFLINHVSGSFVNMVQWWIKGEATQISKSALSAYEADDKREIETRQPSPLSTGSLRISDDAVKALQDGKYNPLLLGGILTDENFLRLMADIPTMTFSLTPQSTPAPPRAALSAMWHMQRQTPPP